MKRAYSDPTADTAIANVERERRRKERLQKAAQQRGTGRDTCSPADERRTSEAYCGNQRRYNC